MESVHQLRIETWNGKPSDGVDDKRTNIVEPDRGAFCGFERHLLQQIKRMGPVGGLLEMIPGGKKLASQVDPEQAEKELKRVEAIINSMTLKERRNPAILNGSRRRRIAQGSGTTVTDVNRLMKQFLEMKKMMQRVSKLGMRSLLSRVPNPFN